MGGLLKNFFFSAVIVVVATVASCTIATIASMILSPATAHAPPPFGALVFALLVAAALAMLTGMFFCVLTLPVAALTMPPVLWLSRLLSLPRPVVDVIGGMLAAWLCVTAAMEEADSLRQYGMTLSEPIYVGVGVLIGGVAGYLRYRLVSGVRRAHLNAASALQAL